MDARSLGLLLSVPVSEEATGRLAELTDDVVADGVASWLWECASTSWIEIDSVEAGDQIGKSCTLIVRFQRPLEGLVRFVVRPDGATLAAMFGETRQEPSTCTVLVDPLTELTERLGLRSGVATGVGVEILVMPDKWTAAVVVEHVRPLLQSSVSSYAGVASAVKVGAEAPYFASSNESELGQLGLDIARSGSQVGELASLLGEDTTAYEERLRSLKRDSRPVEGTSLLATVFLPPLTHSRQAVERFYTSGFGLREESLPLIADRYQWERDEFMRHVERFRRVDIVDRRVLREYMRAPEYYQLPLTVDELRAQVENVLQLLEFENYTLCLCPESIDLSFDIRGGLLRVRADRRNKGQPRLGRVSSLTFSNPALLEVFEREFWTLFRSTESRFKDKDYVGSWLVEEASRYGGPAVDEW